MKQEYGDEAESRLSDSQSIRELLFEYEKANSQLKAENASLAGEAKYFRDKSNDLIFENLALRAEIDRLEKEKSLLIALARPWADGEKEG